MITPPPILLTSKALAKFDFGDLLNHIIDFKNFQLPTYRIILIESNLQLSTTSEKLPA